MNTSVTVHIYNKSRQGKSLLSLVYRNSQNRVYRFTIYLIKLPGFIKSTFEFFVHL